ncbi:hypothetical protein TEQG_02677 [Trichophyton equinum CBS 127.97]|uniref:Uncharacterized protein n=1 Tax=Trichophyton equinum (strain ATCC MYA-4606 / CBS 127.97) TaxID=559882 RepID=F2PP28_TRIEC|nr:hypothetical protein TEQG_02677 [Trichophyton equinum CBS 127.97]
MYRLEKDRSKSTSNVKHDADNYSEPTEGKEVESRRVEHECKRPPAWAESGRGSRDAGLFEEDMHISLGYREQGRAGAFATKRKKDGLVDGLKSLGRTRCIR